jgi:hypothetical protein
MKLIALILAGSLASGGSPPASYRAGTRAHPVYEHDARVRKEAVLKAKTFQIGELCQQVKEQTGLVINFAPGLRSRRVRITTEKSTIRELMDRLAVLVSADWYAVGDRYILSHDRRLVLVSAPTFEEAWQQAGHACKALVDSLTPEQCARIRAGETLGYDDLTPEQRSDAHTWALGAIGNSDNEAFALGPLERSVRLSWDPIGPARLFSRFEGDFGQVSRGWSERLGK